MEAIIDNYRGYEIRFNTDAETFVCDIDDERSIKKSFASLKSFIDGYIKDNANFKPFKVEKTRPGTDSSQITITGIRKDGLFVGVNQKGKTEIIPKYYLKDYMLVIPENEEIKDRIYDIDFGIKRLTKEREIEIQKLKVTTLYEIQQNFTQ